MKKTTAVVISLLICLFAGKAFAESFDVVVDSKTATPGESVEINISLKNNSGIVATLFNVEYDRERLELVEVSDGRILESGTFSPTYASYPYKMLWNSASYTNFTDDGVLATLKFKVKNTAKSGNAFINLKYNPNDIFDVELNNVSINVINGGIEVKGESSVSVSSSGGRKPEQVTSDNSQSTQSAQKNTETDEAKDRIILTIGKKEAVVFGEIKTNDVAPVIRNSRTMLPARFVAESLGAAVAWDETKRTVTVAKDDIEIVITIDSQLALVNGRAIVLDSPAFIENDRTYTPVRFITEKLGAHVEWLEDTYEVIITK